MSTFTWGTVAEVSPLRIRLDGDTAALPFTPDSLVDLSTLVLGDRVRCELSARRVIVIGRSHGGGLPVGTHLPGEWAAAPAGCVLADGAVLNIADWPKLAAHYAATYGAANHHGGDGLTTFAVPDTRERAYVNQGGLDIFAVLGQTTGAKTHTLTVAEMPSHAHDIEVGTTKLWYLQSSAGTGSSLGAMATSGSAFRARAAGGGTPHPIVQPSFVCRYAISAA